VQSLVLSSLHLFGLDEETLAQRLWSVLGSYTGTFVRCLIDAVVQECGEETQQRLGLGEARAAEEREGSPAAAPGPAASRGGSPAPVQPPPAALTGRRQKSSPAPHQPPVLGVPAAPPLLPLPSLRSHKSPRRSQGRPCPGPPLPAGAGNSPRGCPGEPLRGGPAAMGALHRPTRGRSAGGRNELAKAGPGQQPGHLPAPRGTSRASGVISLAVVSKYYNKGLKAAEIALAVLIKQLV